jgi:uncharacterized protein
MPLFNVPQLDRDLGAAADGALLLRHDPGTESAPFVFHAVACWAQNGGEVVHVVSDRAPSLARAALVAYGLSEEIASRFITVDAYTGRMGVLEPADYRIKDASDLESVAAALEQARSAHPTALLVVDSLSVLLDLAGAQQIKRHGKRLATALDAFPAAIAVFTDWGYEKEPTEIFAAFNAVLRLRGVVARIQRDQYFSVERGPGRKTPSRPVPYRTSQPGGVYVYIPKIVVTGAYNAGKTRFIHSVSDSAVSAERQGTTIAMDRGRVTAKGIVTDVFGTPGQERFDPLLDTLYGQALGAIVMVDSTDASTHARARTLLDKAARRGLHVLVAANKQDLAGAVPPDALRQSLELPDDIEVLPCDAADPKSARRVLDALVERILTGGSPQ